MQQLCSGGQRPKLPVLLHIRLLDALCRRVLVRLVAGGVVDVARRRCLNSTSSPLWHLCAVFASKGKVTMERDEI